MPRNLCQSGPISVEALISTRVRKFPFWHLSHDTGCWRATIYNRMYSPCGYVKPEDGGMMAEYEAVDIPFRKSVNPNIREKIKEGRSGSVS